MKVFSEETEKDIKRHRGEGNMKKAEFKAMHLQAKECHGYQLGERH